MNTLRYYFQDEKATHLALNRYQHFAKAQKWYIGGELGKLSLYQLSSAAFAPETAGADELQKFREVYKTIRKWPGVERRGKIAPVEDAFEALWLYGSNFFYGRNLNLTNLIYPSLETNELVELLLKLKFLKVAPDARNPKYPWMFVSKVLHFVNPNLFPIWDTGVVWNIVMWGTQPKPDSPFWPEYDEFCHDNGFKGIEYSEKFNRNYTLWAARYIQEADGEFMNWFSEWMSQNFDADIAKYKMENRIKSLYASAFEFVAIGAAHLERGI